MSPRLLKAMVSMELRKAFAYRMDFWVNFIFSAIGRLTIIYFLWKSVYSFQNTNDIGGRTFEQTMLYFVILFFVDNIVRSSSMKFGVISRDIYDGSLTRYLLYPMDVLPIKFAQLMGQTVVGFAQMALGLLVLSTIIGPEVFPSPIAFVQGVLLMVPAIVLYFMIVFAIELSSFWADNVWSLLVMTQFISGFFGGMYAPITMFPDSVQVWMKRMPFYHTLGSPTEAFLGHATWMSVLEGFLYSGFWLTVAAVSIRWVWGRGVRQYSGVGI